MSLSSFGRNFTSTNAAAIGATTLGSILGGPIGGFIGNAASSLLGSVFGSDDDGPTYQQQVWDKYYMDQRYAKVMPKAMVQGALNAGLHPLVAMGINPGSASIVPQSYNTGNIQGQNLGRAMAAGVQGYHQKQMADLAIERAKLENELLETQITNVNRSPGTAIATASPIPGTAEYLPAQHINPSKFDPSIIAGRSPGKVKLQTTQYGEPVDVPDEKLSQVMEEGLGSLYRDATVIPQLMRAEAQDKVIRNRIRRMEQGSVPKRAIENFKKRMSKLKFDPLAYRRKVRKKYRK
jgi:hypothetical protein